jgi:hypothetical protein
MAESNESGKKVNKLILELQRTNALFFVLILLFGVFILTKSPIAGILAGITFISIFIVDIAYGAQEHGWKEELIGIIKAAGVAVVFWIIVIVLLDSSTPISGIVTCSMLPRYDRGDMIILHGVRNFSEINAQVIEMSADEFSEVYGKVNGPCGATGNLNYLCSTELCQRLAKNGTSLGSEQFCAIGLEYKNRTYYENYSNDIIVYAPKPYGQSGSIAGMDIIHRVFAKIKVGDRYYFITKGDNNQVFDSYWFSIIPEQDVKGKVVLRIPFVGYFKLFITPSFYAGLGADPQGCEKIYERAKV